MSEIIFNGTRYQKKAQIDKKLVYNFIRQFDPSRPVYNNSINFIILVLLL